MDSRNQNVQRQKGRPSVLTDRDLRHLHHEVTRNRAQRKKTWPQVKRELGMDHACDETVRRALLKLGVKRYATAKKPPLSAAMMKRRLAFVNERIKRDDSHQIIFSDETSVVLGNTGRSKVTRTKDDGRYHDECVDPKHKNCSILMFWGCIGYNYKGPCHIFKKKYAEEKKYDERVIAGIQAQRTQEAREIYDAAVRDAEDKGEELPRWNPPRLERYKSYAGGIDWYVYTSEIIAPHVSQAWEEFQELNSGDAGVLFMQDGAGAHVKDESLRMLEELGVKVIAWPGNSPDLNPIETIWNLLKRRIQEKYSLVTSRAEMVAVWEAEWELLDIGTINTVIEHYVESMQDVVSQNGGNFYQG